MDEKVLKRFWEKVDKSNPEKCWEWMAAKLKNGYGRFWDGKKNVLAHRFSYQLLFGTIEEVQQLDHICSNRACVNPNHLRILACRENILRGIGLTAQNARKSVCQKGHALSVKKIVNGITWRECRECKKESNRKWRSNNIEIARESTRKWRKTKTRIHDLQQGIGEVLDGTLPFLAEQRLKKLIEKGEGE